MSILDISFNNDNSVFVVGTEKGFIVYKTIPSMEKHCEQKFNGGIGKVSILNKTNLMVLVGGGHRPHKSQLLGKQDDPINNIIIWDNLKKQANNAINIMEPIKNMFFGDNKHLIIVLKKKIWVFDTIKYNMRTEKNTRDNHRGICVSSFNKENNENKDTNNNKNNDLTIATLGLREGEIIIWKPNIDATKTIQAHNSSITTIALNRDGTLVATASENATNIHVYNTATLKLEYKFRRGTEKYITEKKIIYDIAFDHSGKYMACCTSGGTIHVWDLNKDKIKNKNTKSIFSFVGEYVDYFNSDWSMYQCNIGPTCKMKCGFDEKGHLHVVTYEGHYFKIIGPSYTNDKLIEVDLNVNNIK